MNYHIVRMNEKIEKIALLYNLDIFEIKKLNQHIRDWDNLIAGTKLSLPSIPEALQDDLNDIEPFIEEYYPKINNYVYQEPIIKEETKPQETTKIKTSSTTKNINYPKQAIYYNGYYPPYPPYYPYYPPYNLRMSKPKKGK